MNARESLHAVAGICPATLRSSVPAEADAWLERMYDDYHHEMEIFCQDMARTQRELLRRKATCDFGDREGELLYLLLRELKPEVVVEISPCHGYSTGHILRALTENDKGTCYSYEISEQHLGKPIDAVIRENLPGGVDLSRWRLYVGDVRTQEVPSADVLFIDSAHSVSFASWYFRHLIPRTRMAVMVHDIAIPYRGDCIVPKAAFLGVNEQYFVLQALLEHQCRFLSVADSYLRINSRLNQFTPRHGYHVGSRERSIVFLPPPDDFVARLCDAVDLLPGILAAYVNGDRAGAIRHITDAVENEAFSLFGKLLLCTLLPVAGYKRNLTRGIYPELQFQPEQLSLSEVMCLWECMSLNGDHQAMRKLLKRIKHGQIHPGVVRYLGQEGLRPLHKGRKPWF